VRYGCKCANGIRAVRFTVASTTLDCANIRHSDELFEHHIAEGLQIFAVDLQDEVIASGHRETLGHFLHEQYFLFESRDGLIGVLGQLDLDDGQHLEPNASGIEEGGVTLDGTARFQCFDSPRAGRGRQADGFGEIHHR
jgi:hypothetical protein